MRTIYISLIPALWIAWVFYWGVAAFAVKPIRRQESVASRLSHVLPLAMAVSLLALPHIRIGWLTARLLSPSVTLFWIGAALVAVGLSFSVAARIHLGGNWSGTVTLKQDHTLTCSGPYRIVRHPIYTGLLVATLGSAIAWGECRAWLALVLMIVAFLCKIATEERFMLEQFGESYERYRQDVPALIPGLR